MKRVSEIILLILTCVFTVSCEGETTAANESTGGVAAGMNKEESEVLAVYEAIQQAMID